MADQFCVQCGFRLESESQFCAQCGTRTGGRTTVSQNSSYSSEDANNAMPEAQTSSRRTLLIILLAVLVLLFLTTGAFLIRHLVSRGSSGSADATMKSESPAEQTTTYTTSAVSETSALIEAATIEQTESDPESSAAESDPESSALFFAVDYVPVSGRFYLFEVNYPSGENNQEQKYIGKFSDHVVSSSTTYFPEELHLIGEQLDYIKSEDGISVVYEGSNYKSLWLPLQFTEFDYWADEWESYMIIAVDQTITSGPYTFDNCLVRFYENAAADYQITEYLAPGHGVIYAEYAPGEPALELLEWSDIGLEQANQFLAR